MQSEIIEHTDKLPSTIDELIDFVIVGNEAIKSWKNKVRAIDKAEIAQGAYKQSLRDGQKMGELVLLAEAKLGELLDKIPKQGNTLTSRGGRKVTLPNGINHKESHYAQEIYRHPKILHEVISKKIDRNDIPTRYDVIREIQKRKREETIPTPKLPEGKYNVIYADPPWKIGTIELQDKWELDPITDKYKMMGLEEIKELPVEKLTNDTCSLFLWTTHTFLEKSFEVIKSWGFKYHCCITWDKGGGWSSCGFHRRTEFCLFAYKGKININQTGKFIPTLVVEKKGKHSQKPKVMRDWLISNTPKPRIELFAREKLDDEFDVWGNEVNGKKK